MKFYIKKLILWKCDGTKKIHEFKNNKINLIKAGSNTGKSSFLNVFDYCMLSSSKDIPSAIDRQVDWYGLEFDLNGINHFIARFSPSGSKPSADIYYSNFAPAIIEKRNSNVQNMKEIINKQFNLDAEIHKAYGGPSTIRFSKLSFRPFLLFNTISQDIITSKDIYFDKLNNRQYLGTFPSAFDIATGIYPIEKIDLIGEKQLLEKELLLIEAQNASYERNYNNYLKEVLIDATELGFNVDKVTSFDDLDSINDEELETEKANNEEVLELKEKEYELIYSIKTLKAYTSELNNAKQIANYTDENNFIIDNFRSFQGISPLADYYADSVSKEVAKVKKRIGEISQIQIQLKEKIKALKLELTKIRNKIGLKSTETKLTKYDDILFLKGKISTLKKQMKLAEVVPESTIQEKIDRIEAIDNELNKFNSRDDVTFKINSLLMDSLKLFKQHIRGYEHKELKIMFDYSKKKIGFTLNDFKEILGSESTFLIEHLLLFINLHKYFKKYSDDYVLPFLVIDYMSKPYNFEAGDDEMVFIDVLKYIVKQLEELKDFQLIIIDKVNYESFLEGDKKSIINELEFDSLI